MRQFEKQIEKLRAYFQNTPKEVLDREFAEIEALNIGGPTANEYITKMCKL